MAVILSWRLPCRSDLFPSETHCFRRGVLLCAGVRGGPITLTLVLATKIPYLVRETQHCMLWQVPRRAMNRYAGNRRDTRRACALVHQGRRHAGGTHLALCSAEETKGKGCSKSQRDHWLKKKGTQVHSGVLEASHWAGRHGVWSVSSLTEWLPIPFCSYSSIPWPPLGHIPLLSFFLARLGAPDTWYLVLAWIGSSTGMFSTHFLLKTLYFIPWPVDARDMFWSLREKESRWEIMKGFRSR